MYVIETQGLTKSYGSIEEVCVHALRGVDLHVQEGELLAIMGPSGSGKSTLLHILGGVEVPTSGQVLLEGVDLALLNDDERTILRRERMGFIFQSFNLLPAFTAEENISLPLELSGIPSGEARRRAMDMLKMVGSDAPAAPHSQHPVGRRAAARGHCPGAGHGACLAAGRRADRQSRQRQRPAGHRFVAAAGHRAQTNHRDGHARQRGGQAGRPFGPAPRRIDRKRRSGAQGNSRLSRKCCRLRTPKLAVKTPCPKLLV